MLKRATYLTKILNDKKSELHLNMLNSSHNHIRFKPIYLFHSKLKSKYSLIL